MNLTFIGLCITNVFAEYNEQGAKHFTIFEPEKYNTRNKSTVSRKLPKMDVLTFETCRAVNGEIIKRMTSSWSIFIQLFHDLFISVRRSTCFRRFFFFHHQELITAHETSGICQTNTATCC